MLPVQRQTRTQGRKRRSHRALQVPTIVRCPNCSNSKRPHAACTRCGYVRPGLRLEISKES